ncbi:MAG: hypothetical protein QM831_19185 [Kofleriaceae bacterium]
MKTNRLENIASSNRSSRVRDVVFAGCVALAAVIGLTSVATAANAAKAPAAHTVQIAQR